MEVCLNHIKLASISIGTKWSGCIHRATVIRRDSWFSPKRLSYPRGAARISLYNGLNRGQSTETCFDDFVRQFLGAGKHDLVAAVHLNQFECPEARGHSRMKIS